MDRDNIAGGRESELVKRKPSICFVAHNALGVLLGEDKGHIGGIERQQSMMALWLAQNDYSTSIVTWDEGQPDEFWVKNVRVIKLCKKTAGFKVIRFIWPRWTSLYQAMAKADADIYYYNCGDLCLGQMVIWTRWNRRKLLYSVANEPDCMAELPALTQCRERILYKYGLLRCDMTVVQTDTQQKLLKKGFCLDSTVIPMPSIGFNTVKKKKRPVAPMRVIWIGRFVPEKRLEWLLDIAELCKDIVFDVLGSANVATPYADNLVSRAKSIKNVNSHGRVVHEKVGDYLGNADLLCCTSTYEGFPNTFLEAWSMGIPIVSSFDPGHVISANSLGEVGNNVAQLAGLIRELTSSQSKWKTASKAVLTYYRKNHTLDSSMSKFEKIFHKMAHST